MPYDDTVFLKNSVDILSFFNEDQLRKITFDIDHKTYADKGDVVILKGAVTSGLYIVKKGKAVVTMKPPSGPPITQELGAGEFFGEISLLENTASAVTVKTVEDNTEIITIPHDSFKKLMEMMPVIKKALMDKVKAKYPNSKLST